MKYPKEYLEEIKTRLKVSTVVSKSVNLKKRGKEFVGLSPFKNEKTPSFTVNDEKDLHPKKISPESIAAEKISATNTCQNGHFEIRQNFDKVLSKLCRTKVGTTKLRQSFDKTSTKFCRIFVGQRSERQNFDKVSTKHCRFIVSKCFFKVSIS